MSLYFSKRKFLERASVHVRRQINDHLDIIDGMEVVKEKNSLYDTFLRGRWKIILYVSDF